MSLFFSLVIKIVPLYLNILLGFIANKFLRIGREHIAKLMFFLFAPLVVFNGVVQVELTRFLLVLPILIFLLCTAMCFIFHSIAAKMWNDRTKDLAGFAAGSGNTGYFGLPLALLLLNDQGEGGFILASLGTTFFDNTVGYYMLSKQEKPAYESLLQLFKTPTIYAFALGLLLNGMPFQNTPIFMEFMGHIKGAYTVLGMMFVGFGLATLRDFKLDFKFIRLSFFAKFCIWPLLMMGLIALDHWVVDLFDKTIHQALMLIAIVPLGVNMAILASLFQVEPEKASSAVVLSLLVALLYVPIFATLFF
jgi:predicted permease